MSKFALFNTGGSTPTVTYEGDFMKMEKEFVQIYKWSGDMGGTRLVAAIRLDKGQDVREIE